MKNADIGVIGLAVMGENLIINMESKGYSVAVYNRNTKKVLDFLEGRGKDKNIKGTYSIKELVDSLKEPRKVMIMVKAGQPVDDFIELLIPHMLAGDIIIDGGNSYYKDTIVRTNYLESKGLLYVGMGVSGGEEGALTGPSIMPGGSTEAWVKIKPLFQAIAAKAEGNTCCDWIGSDGAGHFVKMVHNGIEYGDMQLICESYQLMKDLLGMSADDMYNVFKEWNQGELNSYLIEITSDILTYKDAAAVPLIDKILDIASQKGTGKSTVIVSLDEGIPLTIIGEAVYARYLSSMKEERVIASEILTGPIVNFNGDKEPFINDIKNALYMSKIISYAQGYTLLQSVSNKHGWNLDYGSIAMLWRGGCIIRSVFLDKIKDAFYRNPELSNLLLDPFFEKIVSKCQQSLRNVIASATMNGIPIPAFSAALCYYDGYRSKRLPANLIQAQRDYFGAHMYERIDRARGDFYHTNWTGIGGDTSASHYTV